MPLLRRFDMKFAPLLSALCLFSLCAAPTVAEK